MSPSIEDLYNTDPVVSFLKWFPGTSSDLHVAPAVPLEDWAHAKGPGWTEWQPLGGQFTGKPAAISRGDGTTDIFVRGMDDRLWQKSLYAGGSVDWHTLPEVADFKLTSSPAVDSMATTHLHVFARGTDGAVWQKWWTAEHGWLAGWESRGGEIIGDPTACSRSAGVTDVFATGTDGFLWHRWFAYGSGWSKDWVHHSLKPANSEEQPQFELKDDFKLGSAPVANVVNPDRVHVYARADDGKLAIAWWTGPLGWHGWERRPSGTIVGEPGVCSRNPAIIDAFGRGLDNRLWQTSWDGTKWLTWWKHEDGFILDSPPTVCSDGSEFLQLFARGADGQLWGKVWRGQ